MTPADGGAAFPLPNERDRWGDRISEGSRGMSLRDWFAGQALGPTLIAMANGQHGVNHGMTIMQSAATDAYAMADAMLAERAK